MASQNVKIRIKCPLIRKTLLKMMVILRFEPWVNRLEIFAFLVFTMLYLRAFVEKKRKKRKLHIEKFVTEQVAYFEYRYFVSAGLFCSILDF